MVYTLKLYSKNLSELKNFLDAFFKKDITLVHDSYWQMTFGSPLDMVYIISSFIDNNDKYPSTNMWVSIDPRHFHKR